MRTSLLAWVFCAVVITNNLVGAEVESNKLQGIWRFINAGDEELGDESRRMKKWMADNLIVIIGNKVASVFECADGGRLVRLLHCDMTIAVDGKPGAIDLNVKFYLPEYQYSDLVPKTAPEAITGKTIKAYYWIEGDELRLCTLRERSSSSAPKDSEDPGTRSHATLHRVGSAPSGIDLQLRMDSPLLFNRETQSVIPRQASPVHELINPR